MIQTEQFNKDDFEEISRFAQTMGLSTEDYLLGLHEKNQSVKNLLLQDGHGFKQFVEDFHHLLDGITAFKTAFLSEPENAKDEDLLNLVIDLLHKASSDPMLLAQIYDHYDYNKKKDPTTF